MRTVNRGIFAIEKAGEDGKNDGGNVFRSDYSVFDDCNGVVLD